MTDFDPLAPRGDRDRLSVDLTDGLVRFALDTAQQRESLASFVALTETAAKRGFDTTRAAVKGLVPRGRAQEVMRKAFTSLDTTASVRRALDRFTRANIVPVRAPGFVGSQRVKGRPANTVLCDFVCAYDYMSDVARRPRLTDREYVTLAGALKLVSEHKHRGSVDMRDHKRAFKTARALPAFTVASANGPTHPSPAHAFMATAALHMIGDADPPMRPLPTDAEFVLWIAWRYWGGWPDDRPPNWRHDSFEHSGFAYVLQLSRTADTSDGRRLRTHATLTLPMTYAVLLGRILPVIQSLDSVCGKLIALGEVDWSGPGVTVHMEPVNAVSSPSDSARSE